MRILWTAVGFTAGYVMGSKAGRERYEQIRRLATDLWSIVDAATPQRDEPAAAQPEHRPAVATPQTPSIK